MRTLRRHLEKLKNVKREAYHPYIHKLHKKYKISKKTLLYVKEYGPHANVPKTIIRESVKIMLLASIISSLGGFTIEQVRTVFVSIIPMIILLPVLNDMIGDYGIIFSSRFSTLLHTGRLKGKWHKNMEIKKMFVQIIIISFLTALISAATALIISSLSGYGISLGIVYKVFAITVIDVLILVSILFLLAIYAGLYFFRKNEDPGNFLIPITTSVADFGNMLILALLVIAFF